MSTKPDTEDIIRVKGETDPAETYTSSADLTGHSAHLVIATTGGIVLDTIAGVVSGTAVTFAVTSLAVATAGVFAYAIILDKDTPQRRTRKEGDWTVLDFPG